LSKFAVVVALEHVLVGDRRTEQLIGLRLVGAVVLENVDR
jgi:hypothetical protein